MNNGNKFMLTSSDKDLIQYGFDVITNKLEYTLDLSEFEIIKNPLS